LSPGFSEGEREISPKKIFAGKFRNSGTFHGLDTICLIKPFLERDIRAPQVEHPI